MTTDVSMAYVQPTVRQDTSCDTRFENASFWTGIGGMSTNSHDVLGQDGSDGGLDNYFFTEVFGESGDWQRNWAHAQAGDLIEVETRYEQKDRRFVFWLSHRSDHTHVHGTIIKHSLKSDQAFDGSNAQFVVERPQIKQWTGPFTGSVKKTASLSDFGAWDVKVASHNGTLFDPNGNHATLLHMFSRLSKSAFPEKVPDSILLENTLPGGGPGNDSGYYGRDIFRSAWKHC